MTLTTSSYLTLDKYYATTQGLLGDYKFKLEPRWWRVTPYNIHETLHWFCKHIALPGIASLIIPIIIIFRLLKNPIISGINFILYVIAISFLLSVARECIRARRNKINDCLNDTRFPYDDHHHLFRYRLNKILKNDTFKVGFVGDIMKLKKFKLEFDPNVTDFFSDVDLIIGNLEGVVKIGKCPISKQSHHVKILTRLKKILPENGRMLFCLSNNHSAFLKIWILIGLYIKYKHILNMIHLGEVMYQTSLFKVEI